MKCYRTRIVDRKRLLVSPGVPNCLESGELAVEVRRVEVRAIQDLRSGLLNHEYDEEGQIPPDWLKLTYSSMTIASYQSRWKVTVPQRPVASLEFEDLSIQAGSTVKVCASSDTAADMTMELTLWTD